MELRLLLLLLLVGCRTAMGRFGIPYFKYATAEDLSTGSNTCDEDQWQCIGGSCKAAKDPDNDRCYGSCIPLEWKCDGGGGDGVWYGGDDCTGHSDEWQDTCNTNCKFS